MIPLSFTTIITRKQQVRRDYGNIELDGTVILRLAHVFDACLVLGGNALGMAYQMTFDARSVNGRTVK